MAWMDPLRTNLLDLLFELRNHSLPLTVGGGFGLYLKRLRLEQTGQRTLFSQIPLVRATNDLDLFVRADLLCDLPSMRAIADALEHLGYHPVEEAKYMQWKKRILLYGTPAEIKIDLLVGPLGEFRKQLHIKGPRVRPQGGIKLHAHAVEEALHIDDATLEFALSGERTGGEPYQTRVYIPQAFTYLMMKLFAFRDRKENQDKNLGRHHALDIYATVAMQTESEYEESLRLGKVYQNEEHVDEARRIVCRDFSEPTSLGVLRLREHPLFRPDFPISGFLGVLADNFRKQTP